MRKALIMALPVAVSNAGCAVPFTEPPDYLPIVQNQLAVPIDVYGFPFEDPESILFIVRLEPWDTYEFDVRNCVETGLVAYARGEEFARIDADAEEAFCSSLVWKVRWADTTLLNNRPDRRP